MSNRHRFLRYSKPQTSHHRRPGPPRKGLAGSLCGLLLVLGAGPSLADGHLTPRARVLAQAQDEANARAAVARLVELAHERAEREELSQPAGGELGRESEALPSFEELLGRVQSVLGDRQALARLFHQLPRHLRHAAFELVHEQISGRRRETREQAIVAEAIPGGESPPGESHRVPAAIRTVGTGCTYATIQDAISAASSGDEIHVRAQTFAGDAADFNLSNKSLTLIGGYEANCANLPADPDPTVLDASGGAADSVAEISGSGDPDAVTMRNFELTGGEDDSDNGGGIQLSGPVTLSLYNVLVHDNVSSHGGGAIVNAGATLDLVEDSALWLNTATVAGGGVYCDGGSVSIRNGSAVGFFFLIPFPNVAAEDGGGLYLDFCTLWLDDSLGFAGIFANQAGNFGGGVYASNASQIVLEGDQASVSMNSVPDWFGGGLFLWNTELNLDNGVVDGNDAYLGGGIWAGGASTLVDINSDSTCGAARCAQLSHNSAVSGGGLWLEDGAEADFQSAWLEGNEVSVEGSAIFAVAPASLAIHDTMMVDGLAARYVIFQDDQLGAISALIERSTIAGNSGGTPFYGEAAATFTVVNSVIWGNGAAALIEGGAGGSVDCSVLEAESGLPGTGNVVGDPDFVDPAAGDYHLQATSAAIDRCATAPLGPLATPADKIIYRDVDLEQRPHDLRGTANDYDAGADEAYIPNYLFYDGFEGGTTDAWSIVEP